MLKSYVTTRRRSPAAFHTGMRIVNFRLNLDIWVHWIGYFKRLEGADYAFTKEEDCYTGRRRGGGSGILRAADALAGGRRNRPYSRPGLKTRAWQAWIDHYSGYDHRIIKGRRFVCLDPSGRLGAG